MCASLQYPNRSNTLKRNTIIAFSLAFAAGCGGAYEKNEKAIKDTLAALEDMVSACESVNDAASAKAAAARIDEASDRLEKFASGAKNLPKVTKSDNEKLQKEYQPKIEAIVKRAQAAGGKLTPYVMDPDVQRAALKFMRVGEKLRDMSRD